MSAIFWNGLWTIIGVVIGWSLSRLSDYLRIKEDRRIAAMQVANGLRRWMRQAESTGYDIDNYHGPEGPTRQPSVGIPDFPFETTLEAVARLDRERSDEVFELIHFKDDLDEEIDFEIEFGNNSQEDVIAMSGQLLARVYLQAVPIYDHLCKIVDWQLPASAARERVRMQDKVTEYEKDREQHAIAVSEMIP